MAIELNGKSGRSYLFEGPFYSTSSLENKQGLFALFCDDMLNLKLIDIGESEDIRKEVDKITGNNKLNRKCKFVIKYVQFLTGSMGRSERKKIENDIRSYYLKKQ